MVGYKLKGHFFSKTWFDISARGKFGLRSWLDISARGNLETLEIVWLVYGKFVRIVVGYKRKGKIRTKIMVGSGNLGSILT